MEKARFNKKLVTNIRCIYNMGLLRFLLIMVGLGLADEAYPVRWHGQVLKLRKHSSDFHVFRQIQVLGQYDISAIRGLKVETVVDLGANIGLATAWFKSRYPRARVIAVEPEAGNFRCLQENTGGLADVHTLNYAIWNSRGRLGVFDTGAGAYGFKVAEEEAGMTAVVAAITIEDIIEAYGLDRIDVLKVDIEGAEKELFSGDCSSWMPKVGCIVIELHDWLRAGCAAAFFRAIGQRPYSLSFKGENVVVVFEKEMEAHV